MRMGMKNKKFVIIVFFNGNNGNGIKMKLLLL